MCFPLIEGKASDSPAVHELHVYLEVNPTIEKVCQFIKSVNQWNDKYPELKRKMKAYNVGALDEATGKAVYVMLSARNFQSNSQDAVIAELKSDAKWFEEQGFKILRQKIEAKALISLGIPLNGDEMKNYPGSYYEFHVQVARKNTEDKSAFSEAEINELNKLSKTLSEQLRIPVPQSFSMNNDSVVAGDRSHGCRRFFDLRFHKLGLNDILPLLEKVQKTIDKTGSFRHVKNINEYVWYDTYPQLDQEFNSK